LTAHDDERRARNEALFREANERIEAAARTAPVSTTEFLCECSDAGCVRSIPMAITAYEEMRTSSNRFVVAPGHEDEQIEVVVERHADYVVVEKRGVAGETAAETDPRE
jgi:hypothetical protein